VGDVESFCSMAKVGIDMLLEAESLLEKQTGNPYEMKEIIRKAYQILYVTNSYLMDRIDELYSRVVEPYFANLRKEEEA